MSRQEPKYTLIKDLRLVVWHGEDVVLTIREWINWVSIMSGHPDEVLSYDQLTDFRGGTWAIEKEGFAGALKFDQNFFQNNLDEPRNKNQKIAVICNSSAAIEGWEDYVKYTDDYVNPLEIKIFRDTTEAIEWLGHSEEALRTHLPNFVFK